MSKVFMSLLATILMAALSVTACSSENGGGSSGPKAGQTAISLTLSGGDLSAPVEFSGTVDQTMSVFSSSMTLLGTGLDFTGSDGKSVLNQMVLSLESSKAGTYPVKDVDSDMVFFFPDTGTGYSIDPRAGTGTVKVERLGGEHVRLHFDFDASPTNIGGRDLIFHIKGKFESRPKVTN